MSQQALPDILDMPRNSTILRVDGTETFRLRSRMIFRKWGSNLQNIEKIQRQIYRADRGYNLIQVDQSGAEALVVAYLCKPGNFRKLFEHRIKPHTFVAMHLFRDVWARQGFAGFIDAAIASPIEILTSFPEWPALSKAIKDTDDNKPSERYYYLGKKICHSSNYGITPQAFALALLKDSDGQVNLSIRECERQLTAYFKLFPEIRQWQVSVESRVRKSKMLRNLQGYPRLYTQYIPKDKMPKDIIAWVPQSTVATISNIAFTNLQNYIESEGKSWHLLMNNHDSYLAEAPETETDACIEKMQEYMTPTLTAPDGTVFQMRCETQVGKNWYNYHKTKNPDGLREI